MKALNLPIVTATCLSLLCSGSCGSSSGNCPPEASPHGARPPKGGVVWCARADGNKHGDWTEWYSSGTLKTKGQYRDGKMEGTWVTYYEPSTVAQAYDEARPSVAPLKKKQEGAYEANRKKGKWTLFYEDGKFNRAAMHTPASSTVAWVTWRPTGEKWAQGTLHKTRDHGLYKEWHKNGRLAAQGNYVEGEKVGEWLLWDINGNRSATPQGDFELAQ